MAVIYDMQWNVPSESNPDKVYKVSKKGDEYQCSCPAWTRHYLRKNCKHIRTVLVGAITPISAEPAKPTPIIVLAVVEQVTIHGNELYVPLIPIGDTWFEASLVYDLYRAGVPWLEIRDRYAVAKRNSRFEIMQYIEERGRRVYDFSESGGYNGAGYLTLRPHSSLPVVEE